jgi:hypothetical protein
LFSDARISFACVHGGGGGGGATVPVQQRA